MKQIILKQKKELLNRKKALIIKSEYSVKQSLKFT